MGCTLRNWRKGERKYACWNKIMLAKHSHVGEIGEGESDVRCWNRREEWKCTVYSTTGTTWSGSPLWKEATAAMTALVYSILHTRIYRGYVHVYWPRVRRYTRRLTKRVSTVRHYYTPCTILSRDLQYCLEIIIYCIQILQQSRDYNILSLCYTVLRLCNTISRDIRQEDGSIFIQSHWSLAEIHLLDHGHGFKFPCNPCTVY